MTRRASTGWSCLSTLACFLVMLVGFVAFMLAGGGSFIASNTPGGTLIYGDTVSDVIARDEEDEWRFQGQAGDLVAIRMESDFDNYLTLYDSDGRTLANDDDSGSDLNAQIIGFVLPNDGTYVIEARAFASGAGVYSLHLEFLNNIPPRTATAVAAVPQPIFATPLPVTIDQGEVSYGDLVSGRVTTEEGDTWTFRGSAGDYVTISMQGNFDTYLLLLDSDGRELTRDDDSGDSTDALIAAYELPFDGTYTIVARGFAGRTGLYTLQLSYSETRPTNTPVPTATPSPVPEEAGTLEYGMSVNDRVTTEGGDQWAFRGEAGQRVTIQMDGDFDTYLVLMDSDYQVLAYDDDGGEGLNSLIERYRLPNDGTYYIIARGYSGRTGDYTLWLIRER
ncbi:MAG: PPC domain-containing protein [Chloroflexi bacterium]|nr:PPC domain-containing protein [Chloroflexota bacterium]